MAALFGVNNPASKMDKFDVTEMKKLRKKYMYSYSELAREFDISKSQVGRILRGENWTGRNK